MWKLNWRSMCIFIFGHIIIFKLMQNNIITSSTWAVMLSWHFWERDFCGNIFEGIFLWGGNVWGLCFE